MAQLSGEAETCSISYCLDANLSHINTFQMTVTVASNQYFTRIDVVFESWLARSNNESVPTLLPEGCMHKRTSSPAMYDPHLVNTISCTLLMNYGSGSLSFLSKFLRYDNRLTADVVNQLWMQRNHVKDLVIWNESCPSLNLILILE